MDQNTMNKQSKQEKDQDEDVGVMVYGSVRIIDIGTGKIIVNQRG